MKIAPIVFAALISSLLISMPATPQECPSEKESNNSIAVADYVASVPGSGCRQGSIESTDDWDYYRFDVVSPATVTITTETSGDTVIALLDRGGDVIMENDDTEESRASRIEIYLLSGAYYVAVWSYGNASTIDDYRIRIASYGTSQIETESNDSVETADDLGSVPGIASVRGSIETGRPAGNPDVDVYRVTVSEDAASSLAIGTIMLAPDTTETYTMIRLLSPDGGQVAAHPVMYEISEMWSILVPSALPAGEYFVELSWGNASDVAGDYFTLVSPGYGREEDLTTTGREWRVLDMSRGAFLVSGSIASPGEVDHYTLTLDAPCYVTFTTYTAGDTVLALYADPDMQDRLGFHDDLSSEDRRSQLRIPWRLESGIPYYLTVSAYGAGTIGKYWLGIDTQPCE